jgi:histidinol dehydrogenase
MRFKGEPMIKILNRSRAAYREIFVRTEDTPDISRTVTGIIEDVRMRGDEAVLEYTARFDGVNLESLQVTDEEMQNALSVAEPRFISVLERAAANIRRFHEKQIREGFRIENEHGCITGQKITPVDRAGLYVPGGTAAYPSTVLMNSIPAKIAGVPEIVMVSPPGNDGKINPATLAAAYVAGINKIYKAGGAQAIAALAYGTETIPYVDKIVGPGNAFVAEAKRQVYGRVSIDMIAGPSEILIVADGASDPKHIAADLLSQAEHDKMASAVLITDSGLLAGKVSAEIERQIPLLERREIARASIDRNGKIIVTESLDEAIDIVNDIAPEHLELCVNNPFDYLDKVRHAGSIFMGRYCPEALGDYMAGPNHTLPTGGSARFSSPLSVDDFIKKTQFTYYTRDALRDIAEDIAFFAEKEGLTAHAKSAVIRFEEEKI